MKIIRWGVVALGVLGALALASPAQATTGIYPAVGWEHRQIGLAEVAWSDATAGGIVDATTVELTKPDATTGTSIETADLDLPVVAGGTISVSYALLDGADSAAGAVRLFYYDTPNADTLGVAPTASVAADGSGTLELAVVADGTIGTLGLVYDASNSSAGTVVFTDLTVAGTTVLFEAPPVESTPTPTPGPSEGPDPSPSPDAVPTTEAPGAGGELPVTGSPVLLWYGGLGVGAVLAGAGLVAMTWSRRRTVG